VSRPARAPRLVVSLLGGLGNQLFQYACGWAAAEREGRQLVLDAGAFGRYTLRPFLLDRLKVRAGLASARELEAWGLGQGLASRLRRRLFGPKIAEVAEQGFAWRPLSLPRGDARLRGYWQSERYFEGCREGLRRQFAPRHAAKGENAKALARIRKAGGRALALHLRRGDYVSDPRAAAVHGVLGPDYYGRALKALRGKVRNARYFVFSDEPDWAQAQPWLPKGAEVMRGNPPEAPEEDLRLMAACRHFITANSSFSWWGAWLGEGPGSFVAAPKRWFRDPLKDTRDLLPSRWKRL
jgi:hypothetical protein